jgi:Domain of unknown function (DUF305)
MQPRFPHLAGLLPLATLVTATVPTDVFAHDTATHVNSTTAADETHFLSENGLAMDRMVAAMDLKPTGDIDADFNAMMIPHHQGAIDMAVTYLRYGRNEQLRRLAQEIIVEQQQEIVAMHLALGLPLPPSAAAPTQPRADVSAPSPANDHQTTRGCGRGRSETP